MEWLYVLTAIFGPVVLGLAGYCLDGLIGPEGE